MAFSVEGAGASVTAAFARRMNFVLRDDAPFTGASLHFDSRANIIVTNAKLQAPRKITENLARLLPIPFWHLRLDRN